MDVKAVYRTTRKCRMLDSLSSVLGPLPDLCVTAAWGYARRVLERAAAAYFVDQSFLCFSLGLSVRIVQASCRAVLRAPPPR